MRLLRPMASRAVPTLSAPSSSHRQGAKRTTPLPVSAHAPATRPACDELAGHSENGAAVPVGQRKAIVKLSVFGGELPAASLAVNTAR